MRTPIHRLRVPRSSATDSAYRHNHGYSTSSGRPRFFTSGNTVFIYIYLKVLDIWKLSTKRTCSVSSLHHLQPCPLCLVFLTWSAAPSQETPAKKPFRSCFGTARIDSREVGNAPSSSGIDRAIIVIGQDLYSEYGSAEPKGCTIGIDTKAQSW
jgi:hypothetical protein